MVEEIFIGRELNDALPRLLAQARTKVHFSAYELNPTQSITQFGQQPLMPTLRNLAASKLDCRCILASSSKSANIRISNTSAALQLQRHGWLARIAPPYPLQHAKFWLVDDYLAIVGSHNLTISGLLTNNEVSITSHNHHIITKLHGFFQETWEKSKQP